MAGFLWIYLGFFHPVSLIYWYHHHHHRHYYFLLEIRVSQNFARGEGHKMSEMKEGRELEKVVLLGRAGFNAGSNIGGWDVVNLVLVGVILSPSALSLKKNILAIKVTHVVFFHELESVNWTGYKLVYAKGYGYEYICCRDLNKVGQFKPFDIRTISASYQFRSRFGC